MAQMPQMRSIGLLDELSPEQQAQRQQDVYMGLLQAPAYGASMMPLSGLYETTGLMPNPADPSQRLPSTAELIKKGDIEGLGYQGLSVLGDVMYAASPFAPFLAPMAAGVKGVRAGRLAQQGQTLGLLDEAERIAVTKELPYVGTEDFPLENLLGEKIVFIPADRMRTGQVYQGLSESPIERPVPMKGGQKYGTMRETQEQGLGFASLSPEIAKRISQSGARYGIIGAMDAYSQISNKDMADIIAQQVQSYGRSDRISPENMAALTERIRNVGRKAQQTLDANKAAGKKAGSGVSDKARLANLPDLNSQDIFDWLGSQTFETRKQFGLILNQAGSRELGAPSIDRILSETIDPEQAGAMAMQGNVLIRLEGEAPIDVAAEGGIPHRSYPIGILGEPVAQIKYGVRGEDLFSDTVATWLEQGGQPSRLQRMMSMKLPVTEVTGEKLGLFPTGAPEGIKSARQANLLVDFMNGNWRSTIEPVNVGGLGAAEIRRAYQNNTLSETLTPYSEKALKDGAKDGSLVFYGLGRGEKANGNSGQIYFGLKKGMDYNTDFGLNNPELSPDDVAVVGVMNNELGQAGAGLGVPTSMLKAIEEGATVLDAYAVPSKANPSGFLPEYYRQFGFREVERVPFDEKYVRNPEFGGSEKKYQSLLKQWRQSGWDEEMGMPPLVIMKWKGDDASRQNTVRDYVEQSAGRFGRESAGFVSSARGGVGRRSSAGVQAQKRPSQQGDGGRNTGGLLSDGVVLSPRFARAIGEVSSLTDTERRALGLLE